MESITANFDEPLFTIGVVANMFGILPQTLRKYEKEGLIIPYRTNTGRRLYSQRDLEWIDCFRNQIHNNQMNIAGVKLILALMPCWDIKSCSVQEQRCCPTYFNSGVICWTLGETSIRSCKEIDCRNCMVYMDACRAGKLDTMYVSSMVKL